MSQPHERTFLMIKPDGVQRGLVGTIIERFEKKGLKLVAIKFVKPSEQLLREQYSDRSNKSYFLSHLKYMSSGPVVPMVWEGLNVVKTGRQMLGGTKPKNSLPGTIRGDLSISFHNVIHGSDSIESANKEIGMWFKAEELHNWTPVTENCVYQ